MVVGEGSDVICGSSWRSPIGACWICFSCSDVKIGGSANSASIGSGILRYCYTIKLDDSVDDAVALRSRGEGGRSPPFPLNTDSNS